MRKIVLAALAAICISAPALAQQAAAPPSQASTNTAAPQVDLKTVRDNVKPLATAFGVDTPDDPAANNTQAVDDEHKTVGDVADRALGDVEKVTAKLSGTL